MTYVIAQPCVDVKDRACVDECPVDCIYAVSYTHLEWSGGEKRSAPDCASQRSRACALAGAFSSDVDEVGARDRLP